MPRPRPTGPPRLDFDLLELDPFTMEMVDELIPNSASREQFLTELYEILEGYKPLALALDHAPRDKNIATELSKLESRASALTECLDNLRPHLRAALATRLSAPEVDDALKDRYLSKPPPEDPISRLAASVAQLRVSAEEVSKHLEELLVETEAIRDQLHERMEEAGSRGGRSRQARDILVVQILRLLDDWFDDLTEADQGDLIQGALKAAGAPCPETVLALTRVIRKRQADNAESALDGKGTSRPE